MIVFDVIIVVCKRAKTAKKKKKKKVKSENIKRKGERLTFALVPSVITRGHPSGGACGLRC